MRHRQLRVEWDPQPDITAYELALALPFLLDLRADKFWVYDHIELEKLLPEIKRHFKVRDLSKEEAA